MRLRIAVLLIVLAVAMAGGVALAIGTSAVRGDTVCGPVALQRNKQFQVCEDFHSSRTAWAVGLAAVATGAAVAAVRLRRPSDGRASLRIP